VSQTINYDPRIIKAHATNLYMAAERLVRNAAILGGVIGILVGFVVGFGLGSLTENNDIRFFAAIFGAAGGTIGLSLFAAELAKGRAFQLKLQAQLAMCQVQIEENTRRFSPDGPIAGGRAIAALSDEEDE
jgi:hypothetical protein